MNKHKNAELGSSNNTKRTYAIALVIAIIGLVVSGIALFYKTWDYPSDITVAGIKLSSSKGKPSSELDFKSVSDTIDEIINVSLGDDNPFNDNSLIYESDKQNVYYLAGNYYVVQDNVVKQIQKSEVVPREQSLLDYLNTIPEFNQENSTFKCYDMEGNETNIDLSTPWENSSFGEVLVYWKCENSNGTLVYLVPDSVCTITNFLYYSDLLSAVDEG